MSDLRIVEACDADCACAWSAIKAAPPGTANRNIAANNITKNAINGNDTSTRLHSIQGDQTPRSNPANIRLSSKFAFQGKLPTSESNLAAIGFCMVSFPRTTDEDVSARSWNPSLRIYPALSSSLSRFLRTRDQQFWLLR